MSMKMNNKKNKKGILYDGSAPHNNNKKKGKLLENNMEFENNVLAKETKQESENNDVLSSDSSNTKVKVGRKRKQLDTNTEFLHLKKSKKRKEETGLNDLSSSGIEPDTSDTVTMIPKKSRKKKKLSSTSNTNSFIITDENGGSVNILELPLQQNGNSIEDIKEVGHNSSFHITDETPKYRIKVKNDVMDDINVTGDSTEEKVVHISIKDVDDTDSDFNENDFLTIHKQDIVKGSKQAYKNWPKEDLKKLVDRMEACIPENDGLAFSTRVEKLQWDDIAFKDYTVEECKNTWLSIQKQTRRFRLLKEVLVDAKEWINSPKIKSKKKSLRHPDMPRKPLSAYFLYYMKKRDNYNKSHPGVDATEVSKVLAQEFRGIPPEKKLKYERLAAKKKEEYDTKLEEFYQTHPDVPRIVKQPRVRQEKAPKPPKPPKPPKLVKEKPGPKPSKDRIPKRPPPPFQLFYLSELEKEEHVEDKTTFKELCKERWKELHDRKKLVWINYAEAEYAKYEDDMQLYIQRHPDYLHNPHKSSVLTKEDIQIKERAAGKPNKPPGSAYNLFSSLLLHSDEIKAVPVKDRLVYVSNKWKNCAEEEKSQFRDLFAQMIEKYKLEMATYLETLPEEERKKELLKITPKRRKSEDAEKAETTKKKRSVRKSSAKKLVEPEQPPISAFKYFAALYTGEEPAAQAWKALTAEQKKIYEDELVRKKQAYIINFERFLKSLTKEELEDFSNSRRRIKKEQKYEAGEEGNDSSEESESDDSEEDSNDQEENDEEEEEEEEEN